MKSRLSVVFGIILSLLMVLCGLAVYLVYPYLEVGKAAFSGNLLEVAGMSMSPSLNHGDKLIITDDKKSIKRGDIIVFKNRGIPIISRVIGLPGEEVKIENGQLLINNKTLDITQLESTQFDTSVYEENEIGTMGTTVFQLKEDEYFVMGDNHIASKDSRASDIGPVSISEIEGVFVSKVKF